MIRTVENRARSGREALTYVAAEGSIDGTAAPALFTASEWADGVARAAKNPEDLAADADADLLTDTEAWIRDQLDRSPDARDPLMSSALALIAAHRRVRPTPPPVDPPVDVPTISIDQGASFTLLVGDTLPLTATVSDGATPVWSSSDALVLSVDATGMVTALAEGPATITATHPTEPTVTASIAGFARAVETTDAVADFEDGTLDGWASQINPGGWFVSAGVLAFDETTTTLSGLEFVATGLPQYGRMVARGVRFSGGSSRHLQIMMRGSGDAATLGGVWAGVEDGEVRVGSYRNGARKLEGTTAVRPNTTDAYDLHVDLSRKGSTDSMRVWLLAAGTVLVDETGVPTIPAQASNSTMNGNIGVGWAGLVHSGGKGASVTIEAVDFYADPLPYAPVPSSTQVLTWGLNDSSLVLTDTSTDPDDALATVQFSLFNDVGGSVGSLVATSGPVAPGSAITFGGLLDGSYWKRTTAIDVQGHRADKTELLTIEKPTITEALVEADDLGNSGIVSFRANNGVKSVLVECYQNGALVNTRTRNLVEWWPWIRESLARGVEEGDTIHFALTPYSNVDLGGSSGDRLVTESVTLADESALATYFPGTTAELPRATLDRMPLNMVGASIITVSSTGFMGDGTVPADFTDLQAAFDEAAVRQATNNVLVKLANGSVWNKSNTTLRTAVVREGPFWVLVEPESTTHLPPPGTRFVPAIHDPTGTLTPWLKQTGTSSITTMRADNYARRWRFRGIGFGVADSVSGGVITAMIRMEGPAITRTLSETKIAAFAEDNSIRRSDGGSFVDDGFTVGMYLSTHYTNNKYWTQPANKRPKMIIQVLADRIITSRFDELWVDEVPTGPIWLEGTSAEILPADIHFEQVWVKGVDLKEKLVYVTRGIWLLGDRQGVYDSWIENIERQGGENQAVYASGGAVHFVHNNYLSSTGENFMLHESNVKWNTVRDVTFTNNWCAKPLRWNWNLPESDGVGRLIKNAWECKVGHRVYSAGNVFDHMWLADQDDCLNVKLGEQNSLYWQDTGNIVFEKNLFRRVYHNGMAISGHYDNAPSNIAINNESVYSTRKFVFENNLFLFEPGAATAISKISGDIDIAWFRHNTFAVRGGGVMWSPWSGAQKQAVSLHLIMENNVFPRNTNGIKASGTAEGSVSMLNNGTPLDFAGNVIPITNINAYPLQLENSYVSPQSNFVYADEANGDYSLPAGNPYRAKSTDGTDPGYRRDELLAAIAGVADADTPI